MLQAFPMRADPSVWFRSIPFTFTLFPSSSTTGPLRYASPTLAQCRVQESPTLRQSARIRASLWWTIMVMSGKQIMLEWDDEARLFSRIALNGVGEGKNGFPFFFFVFLLTIVVSVKRMFLSLMLPLLGHQRPCIYMSILRQRRNNTRRLSC